MNQVCLRAAGKRCDTAAKEQINQRIEYLRGKGELQP